MGNKKDRNNFVYTNHFKERIKERSINLDDVKLTVRNPDYEKRYGICIKSFRKQGVFGSNVRELVVVWKWEKDQLIIQTTYHKFIKFK